MQASLCKYMPKKAKPQTEESVQKIASDNSNQLEQIRAKAPFPPIGGDDLSAHREDQKH
jgi:hypothetical protein